MQSLQRCADRIEFALQRGADAIGRGNDRQCDTGRNQSVLNRGCTTLVGNEFLQDLFHDALYSVHTKRDGNLASDENSQTTCQRHA